jgi:hypothetical protein
MFLAKTWKTVKGKRYESWVLKEGVWDKQNKRYKQIYLAYIGKMKTITESRARELARKISAKLDRPVSVEDLRKVRRLRIVPDREPASQKPASKAQPVTTPEVPGMIADLRAHFGLDQSFASYEELVQRIGAGQHLTGGELMQAELGDTELSEEQAKELRMVWRFIIDQR